MSSRGRGSSEQIGRFTTPGQRRSLKREARRKDRQDARRLREDAPSKRRYVGWAD